MRITNQYETANRETTFPIRIFVFRTNFVVRISSFFCKLKGGVRKRTGNDYRNPTCPERNRKSSDNRFPAVIKAESMEYDNRKKNESGDIQICVLFHNDDIQTTN